MSERVELSKERLLKLLKGGKDLPLEMFSEVLPKSLSRIELWAVNWLK